MRSLTESARNIKDTDEQLEIIGGLNYFTSPLRTVSRSSSDLTNILR
jgi:hypothetical protein